MRRLAAMTEICQLCRRPIDQGERYRWDGQRAGAAHESCILVDEVEGHLGPSSRWHRTAA